MKYLVEIEEIKDPRLKKIEPLAGRTNNPDIEADCQLSDDLSALLENSKASTFAIPFLSQLRNTSAKLRRSLKLRIECDKKQSMRNQETSVQNDTNLVPSENSVQDDESESLISFDDNDADQNQTRKINPNVGEYWTICNGETQFRYVMIVSEDPLEVKVG